MCGRFLICEDSAKSIEHLVPLWEEIPLDFHFGTIYPSNKSIVIKNKDGKLAADLMEFGFYSSSMKKRIINARSETADRLGMFKHAWNTNRCVVPATIFYEWTPGKIQYSFEEPKKTMYIGALVVENQFVILTRPADRQVNDIHHRMPVLLQEDEVADWIMNPSKAKAFVLQTPPHLNHWRTDGQLSLF